MQKYLNNDHFLRTWHLIICISLRLQQFSSILKDFICVISVEACFNHRMRLA